MQSKITKTKGHGLRVIMGIMVMLSMDNLISQAKSFGNLRNISNVDFLSSGGTSTGANVAMCVFRKNWVRDCGG